MIKRCEICSKKFEKASSTRIYCVKFNIDLIKKCKVKLIKKYNMEIQILKLIL